MVAGAFLSGKWTGGRSLRPLRAFGGAALGALVGAACALALLFVALEIALAAPLPGGLGAVIDYLLVRKEQA